jgi:RNA polymerase subunit RPABC4/transcription elongation factor Spt4
MFFIAGISPKIKLLDNNPRRCPVCGMAQAYYKRVDHYLSIFFIPVLRVKMGEPFIMCDPCERTILERGKEYYPGPKYQNKKCRNCGSTLQKDFKYCPDCGKFV